MMGGALPSRGDPASLAWFCSEMKAPWAKRFGLAGQGALTDTPAGAAQEPRWQSQEQVRNTEPPNPHTDGTTLWKSVWRLPEN
jgi:hypothetical protein